MKEKIHRLIAKAGQKGARQNGTSADLQLESAVDQLLGPRSGCDGAAAEATRADLLAARNGGCQAYGRTLGEDEIESLLARMVFSEQAFLKYSH